MRRGSEALVNPLAIMLRPGTSYARLAAGEGSGGMRVLLRGPLFIALAIACSISILTRGYLAPPLIASSMVSWSFVPLAGIAGLAAVWRSRRREIPFAAAVDLFFVGYAPTLLWLVAFAVFWASFGSRVPPVFFYWEVSAAIVGAWSAYIDFQFFRNVPRMERPLLSLVIHRTIAWTLFIAVFGGYSFIPGIVEEFGFR
jgi:hypothetical protein